MTDNSISLSCALLVVNADGVKLDDYTVVAGTICEQAGQLLFTSTRGDKRYRFPASWKARISETPWDQLDTFGQCRFFIPISESIEQWLQRHEDEYNCLIASQRSGSESVFTAIEPDGNEL